MNDGLRLIGRLRVIDLPSDEPLFGDELAHAIERGHARIDFVSTNLLVNQGLSVFSRIIGNNVGAPLVGGSGFTTLSDITVRTMDLGNTTSPPTPAITDTTGVGALVYSPPLIVTYPDNYSVMFSGVIPQSELIGTTITEECLKLGNGKVFAKKAPFSTLKTGSHAKQFDHTIIVSRG